MEKKETKQKIKTDKIKELTNDLQHLQAEFENYKKRCDKDNASFKEYVIADFAAKLLPIIDSFELALKNKDKNKEFIKGIELIFAQLYDMLKKEGIRPIDSKGKLDPYKHEVLMTEKTGKDEEDDEIVEELQKGYMFKDKVLRFAKVKVKKK